MILADKIISLRKRAGWSQEELAQRLNVTRQSVSKWEGAQSTPDMDKIVQMSRLFGVTTDYLLKEELEEWEGMPFGEEAPLRQVTMEEAEAYLALRRQAAPRIALGTFLCVISPVLLILLPVLSQAGWIPLGENVAAGIGLCALLALVAVAVVLFLTSGGGSGEYAFLESEPFEWEYGVIRMVQERKRSYQSTYIRMNTLGTILCILSPMPLLLAACITDNDGLCGIGVCVLLVLVALGCIAFVWVGVNHAAMEKLLQEGEYTPDGKVRSRLMGSISAVYWMVTTAIFLWYTFGPRGNGQPQYSWWIWAVAGVLYGAVVAIVKIVEHLNRR